MPGKKKNIIELTHCDVASYRSKKKLPFRVMTDNVRSMQNIGAIFRTSDPFLVEEVILGGISAVPPHPLISKSALGAEESVSWSHVDDCLAEVLRLKGEGFTIFVLEQTHNSVSLAEVEKVMPKGEECKILLVVGNEVEGVDQRIVDVADAALEIPMEGVKHSLNVSVSAGIAIWELYKLLSVSPHPIKNVNAGV